MGRSLIDTKRQFHVQTLKGEVGRYCILPGDPGRVEMIAQYLDDAKPVAYNREYNIYTGTICGVAVTVCSTGMGGPSTAIAVEELIKCGADTFIRLGTCGGMNDKVHGGDLIIANAAMRGEGTSYEYLPEGYPCVAHFDVTDALKHSAENLCDENNGNSYHIGVVHSKDSFYGQVEPDNSPVAYKLNARWQSYIKAGCLASEMECAALYAVGQARDARCGAVLTALWNMEHAKNDEPDKFSFDHTKCIKCVIGAIEYLIEKDK
ncbi:MAG: nucleoside phosphorylase [Ruminococcus sp.]|nr:nucleoside phosphorylase [Ruminococcus sp.]